jgi:aryl-alcohol dehydrogenase-like predicted oxidoreductase
LDRSVLIEGADAMAAMINAGYVRAVGLSEVGPETIARAHRVHPIADPQIKYSLLKTRADLFEQVRARLASLHPYECPEIVQLRVEAGHEPYLSWLAASVRPRSE